MQRITVGGDIPVGPDGASSYAVSGRHVQLTRRQPEDMRTAPGTPGLATFDDVVGRDWVSWHKAYDEPGSSLERRLRVVQRRVAEKLDEAPPGQVRIISMCAGQGRDLLSVLAQHPRRADVTARLVELDAANVAVAREAARRRRAGTGGGPLW